MRENKVKALSTNGLMEEMTWPEIAEAVRQARPVVLPVGATEQHGPHLPLGTDCFLPTGVALEVAKRLPLVVAPPIRFGAQSRALSGGGETFPGTLSLRGTTLLATVHDIVRALVSTGFTRICVQNWHVENSGFLWEACDSVVREFPEARILLLENAMPDFSSEELSELFPKGFRGWDVEHAAQMETSMMIALRPELVRHDRIVDDHAVRHPTWDVLPTPEDFIPKTGVLWHATDASEEIGRRFVEGVARRLEDALRTEFDL